MLVNEAALSICHAGLECEASQGRTLLFSCPSSLPLIPGSESEVGGMGVWWGGWRCMSEGSAGVETWLEIILAALIIIRV